MRHLQNTLFITSEDIYLSLDGENVLANRDKQVVARYPLHTLQGIISFSYSGASPALMGACAQRDIDMAFCSPRGKFLARISGIVGGNVLLRREQYRIADDLARSCEIARNMIFGKIYNSRWNLERAIRDHGERIDINKFHNASGMLKKCLSTIQQETNLDTLRGTEGVASKAYYDVFDDMLLRNKEHFYFHIRSRRPPLDRVNALLSFAYTLLASDCSSALESVGLDSYVGLMHRDCPGRRSMALDLMEEFRPCVADRFVLALINNRMISPNEFEISESGAVIMKDSARKVFLKAWHERKQESLTHPYLKEKMPWGLVPYMQALLLARYIRGDLDAYPPFLWK